MSLEKAREVAKRWFERGLRGSNRHGPAQRALLCDQLEKTLKSHAGVLCAGAADVNRVAEALERGSRGEEGPLVCSLLSRELIGSRYEGLWISREGPGLYLLGDEHDGSGL